MPARKPTGLNTRHDSLTEKEDREKKEAAMKPRTRLDIAAPARLSGHKTAIAQWKKTIGLYQETEAEIATAFDENLLIDYCLIVEELPRLEKLRDEMQEAWSAELKTVKRMKNGDEKIKQWGVVNALYQNFKGMDARVDGKRKLKHEAETKLYLTPRSRAGVAPPEKPKEPPKSGIESLIDGNNE